MAIAFKKQVSPPDTGMMLDRRISMFSDPQSVPDEKEAAQALLDYYGSFASPFQVGVGRFGNDSGVSADIIGTLTSSYGSRATSTSTGLNAPGGHKTSPSSLDRWMNPDNAQLNDSLYATDATNGDQQGYINFGFNTTHRIQPQLVQL